MCFAPNWLSISYRKYNSHLQNPPKFRRFMHYLILYMPALNIAGIWGSLYNIKLILTLKFDLFY